MVQPICRDRNRGGRPTEKDKPFRNPFEKQGVATRRDFGRDSWRLHWGQNQTFGPRTTLTIATAARSRQSFPFDR
ncbi:hypothetical protein RJT34_20649 [Clitoria ternatea]|uniref:Uncharacterized protein n=1 Tax=Clitoria ternatea TaxID=43366 RepID=A0AAN9ITL3_CLITE